MRAPKNPSSKNSSRAAATSARRREGAPAGGLPIGVYSATKHAVNGFIRGLRMELADSGVNASAFCPARVTTEFSSGSMGQPVAHLPGSEPVERVVQGMVCQLGRDWALLFPTWQAWLTGRIFGLTPWLMAWVGPRLLALRIAAHLAEERLGTSGQPKTPSA